MQRISLGVSMVAACPPLSANARGSAVPPVDSRRRAEQQRVRRSRRKAREHLQRYLLVSVRSGIFPLTSYGQLPEVARMNWLLARCSERKWTADMAAAALLIDCAARSPQFTLAAAATVLAPGPRDTVEVAVVRLLSLHGSRTWPSFWRGRSSGLAKAVCSWTAADVLRVSGRLAQAGRKRKRTHEILDELCTLRGVGPYLSVGIMRLVLAVIAPGGIRGCETAAACMSDHVQMLHAVMHFRDARRFLQTRGITGARHWDAGFSAYLYCEVAKVLRLAGVLRPLPLYRGELAMLETDLASAETRECLQHLEEALATLPDVTRCPPEIVETARTLGLPRHSMVQVQALSVYKQLCRRSRQHA